MELKEQVCSLEQAKRLKELGVTAPGLFWWTQDKTPDNRNLHYYGWAQDKMPWELFYSKRSILSGSTVFEEYPAYTVAELGEMLPTELEYKNCNCYVRYLKANDFWYCQIRTISDEIELLVTYSESEAVCRAQMLIYLLENKLI